jgi:hypothetical protein
MGYDPSEEKNSRYYTTGFRGSATVNPAAYTSAENSGLSSVECPATLAGDNIGSFLAGKKVAGNPAILDHHIDTGAGSSTIGTQADENTQTFTAGAAGVVHKKFTSPSGVASGSSYMTIDQAKVIRIIRNGF